MPEGREEVWGEPAPICLGLGAVSCPHAAPLAQAALRDGSIMRDSWKRWETPIGSPKRNGWKVGGTTAVEHVLGNWSSGFALKSVVFFMGRLQLVLFFCGDGRRK